MVVIPNSDRDDMVRYIDLLCEAYKEKAADSTVAYNLYAGQVFSASRWWAGAILSFRYREDIRTDITKRYEIEDMGWVVLMR